jgi:DNA-binding NarL/FixJ family response regulator
MGEILACVAQGETNWQIAARFIRSSAWVEKRLQEIYAALDCTSHTAHTKRAEAVYRAMKAGVIS